MKEFLHRKKLEKCIATRPSLNEMFKEEKTGTQNF